MKATTTATAGMPTTSSEIPVVASDTTPSPQK